ncbi:hypothetical protein [Litoribacter populi]|uniref:hypothetical protein n=1 Tax=Litoribacter populi TaxID=2598460 RepID=UPI0011800C6B|nr:hypothetical protein [Litoribacter populi]
MTELTHLQKAIKLIKDERKRQIEVKGFTPEHDDNWNNPQDLILAAATYQMEPEHRTEYPFSWPWHIKSWKPTAKQGIQGRIRELVKAGALYIAAKETLERRGIEHPLKQACCKRVDGVAEMIAELMRKEHEAVLPKSEA